MDVGFYLLIPEIPHFDGFEYHLETFSWGGEQFPQEPGRYVWGDHVQFVKADVTDFLLRVLPEGSISPDWTALCLTGHALDMLQKEVRGIDVDWGGKPFEEVLRQILQRSIKWVVVFALHNDQIDTLYRMAVDACIERLKHNLRCNANVEGFMVIPPNHD